MVGSKPNSVVQYSKDQMIGLRKLYGFDNEIKLNEALNHIEEWVLKQNHFLIKKFDKRTLEFILIQCKGSSEKTKRRLDKYCTMRTIMPEVLQNYDVKNEFKNLQEYVHHCVLPKLTEDYYRITLGKVYNDEKFNLLQYVRYMINASEYCLENDYNQGYIGIVDLQNVGFGMASKINPILLQKFLVVFTDCYGARIKSLHLINGSKYVNTIASILKQAMSAKIASRLQIHSNWESLHKFIPKELLPSDYGGELKSILELQEETFKAFTSDEHAVVMKEKERYKTDESLRLSSNFNQEYLGTPGSFRMFNVD